MTYDLSKEDDVKQYLDNLGIEYRFECFHEKKPDGCHRLGDYMEAVKKDFKKAAKIYQNACDELKFGQSCYKYANYSYLGRGCNKSKDVAFDYYKRGCLLEYPEACLHAGLMLTAKDDKIRPKAEANGEAGGEKNGNFVAGAKYFDLGCSKDNATSCFFASSVYMMGTEGVPIDYDKAFAYSSKACDLGNVYACANLSRMYLLGNGTAKDEAKAKEMREKAIELKNQHVKKFRQMEFQRS